MNTPSGSGSEATNSPTLVARLRAPIERYSAWARSHQRSEAVDKRWSAACVTPYDAIGEWITTSGHAVADDPREIYLNFNASIFSPTASLDDPCVEIEWPYRS